MTATAFAIDFHGDMWDREAHAGYVQYSFMTEYDISATVVFANRHDWSFVIMDANSREVLSHHTAQVLGQWRTAGTGLYDVIQEACEDLTTAGNVLAEAALDDLDAYEDYDPRD
jgi:hypothetical protein